MRERLTPTATEPASALTPASKWEAHPSHLTRQGASPPEAPCLPYRTANRACHVVHDVLVAPRGGMRTYAHFARRSLLPARADGKTIAVRHSPPLVDAALNRPGGVLFRSDAEFNFMNPAVPTLDTRTADDRPATEQHPTADDIASLTAFLNSLNKDSS